MILDVGPPDVGLHVELTNQRGQDRTAHFGLGKRQLHPNLAHLFSSAPPSIRFMLPEVKPSRSNATKRKPADCTAATTSRRRASTAPRTSGSNSRRAAGPWWRTRS